MDGLPCRPPAFFSSFLLLLRPWCLCPACPQPAPFTPPLLFSVVFRFRGHPPVPRLPADHRKGGGGPTRPPRVPRPPPRGGARKASARAAPDGMPAPARLASVGCCRMARRRQRGGVGGWAPRPAEGKGGRRNKRAGGGGADKRNSKRRLPTRDERWWGGRKKNTRGDPPPTRRAEAGVGKGGVTASVNTLDGRRAGRRRTPPENTALTLTRCRPHPRSVDALVHRKHTKKNT